MHSRKTALATMEMTAMARWNRLTTRKVCEDSEAMARRRECLVAERAAVESGRGGVGRHARSNADAEPVDTVGSAEQRRRDRAGAS